MHYCDVTNLSGRSRKHNPPTPTSTPPGSVHYKSLVIGLLLCRQVLLSGGAPWAPWRSRRGDPSHLVWVAQVCYPRASALFLKGTSCRESRRSADLPARHNSSSKAPKAEQRSIGDTKSIWNSFAPSPTPLSRLCQSCQFVRTHPLNYHFPNCSRPYQSPCHLSPGLKLAVMTSRTAPGRHLLSICQSSRAQRNKVLLTSLCTHACKFNKSRHREIHRNLF